jgi:hypothetical protein
LQVVEHVFLHSAPNDPERHADKRLHLFTLHLFYRLSTKSSIIEGSNNKQL